MARLKAPKLPSIDALVAELRAVVRRLLPLGCEPAGESPGGAAPARPEAAASSPARGRTRKVRRPSSPAAKDSLEPLLEAFRRHPRQDELRQAGERKDQLLRALIPLYVAQELELALNSGAVSRFWSSLGLRFAAPNVAKALRQKPGHARSVRQGWRISAAGVQYVEAALSGGAGAPRRGRR